MTLETRKHLDRIHDDVEYYEHQLTGVRQMVRMRSVILADDMGLGKSLQALTVGAVDFEKGYANRILIVCPKTLKGNWAAEIEKHTKFTYAVLDGTPAQRQRQLDEFSDDILIVGYEQMVNSYGEIMAMGKWDILIVDEAHYIKNHKSKRAKAVLKAPVNRAFMLTGSPILNRANELWALLNKCDPVRFCSYWKFVNRFCNTPDAPIWMADGTMKPLGDIQVGDVVMGWTVPEESTIRYGAKRIRTGSRNLRKMLTPSTVEVVAGRRAEVFEFTLEDGETFKCTADHKWLSASHAKGYEWIDAFPVGRGMYKGNQRRLSRVVLPPRTLSYEEQRAADYLAGICDGEASWPFIAQSKKSNPETYQRISECLDILKFDYTAVEMGFRVRGGRQAMTNMLCWGNPAKRTGFNHKLIGQLNRTGVRVVSWRSLGVQPVVSMQTSTGNYVAWGLASKNCVYGGFQSKQIVGVKNKAELKSILGEYMIRRLKEDVLDLPDKQYIEVFIDLHPKQREIYDKAANDLIIDDLDQPLAIENAMTRMLRLKQIIGTPATLGLDDDSHKLDRAVEMIQRVH